MLHHDRCTWMETSWKEEMMAVRIRKNGRIFCAAMYPEEEDDVYIDDRLHEILSLEAKVLVTDDNHINGHGEWWWKGKTPDNINVATFYKEIK